jgi:cell division protein FtsB
VTARPHRPVATVVAVLALIALAYFGFTTAHHVIHNYQLRGEEQRLRDEIQQLDRDREQLTSVRDYLSSDEYIEYVARRTLGLVRPGETLVIVSGTTPIAAATPSAPDASATPQPWWKALFMDPEAQEPSPAGEPLVP